MSKSKISLLFCAVVLFAVVAVFSHLNQAGPLHGSSLMGGARSATSIGILSADGSDPQPPPRPLPWLTAAA